MKKEYIFDLEGGSKLNLYSESVRGAREKAKRWERWLKKNGNYEESDKVILSSIKEVRYDKDGNNPKYIKV